MNKPPLIRTENQIHVILNGRPYIADSSHGNFSLLVEAIREERWDDLEGLFDIKTAFKSWSEGLYEITEEAVTYQGERLPPALERRVIAFWSEGEDFKPLLAFYSRLQANPSRRSVQELFNFLEHKNIPIDDEGYFYAYKAIRSDWKDIFSGTVDNSIGAKPSMARNRVDDNCNNHCSHGYHVGSLQYVQWYGRSGGRYVICRVDPADVVSVPLDHQCQKVRVTTYEVVSEFTGALPETRWSPTDEDREEEEWPLEDVEDDFDEWRDELEEERAELEDEIESLYRRIAEIETELDS